MSAKKAGTHFTAGRASEFSSVRLALKAIDPVQEQEEQ